ncbi:MAG: hypothetical protein VB112_02880 [Oscillospiraceae bacterium]|nr:hypothetical protein [Oscillospiraceae bacterium]
MRLYLSAAPERMAEAERLGLHPAHLAYRAERGGHLLIKRGCGNFRGGLLVLTDAALPRLAQSEAECLSREICTECSARGFEGAAADFEAAPDDGKIVLLRCLCAALRADGRKLYVPEAYGRSVSEAVVLVCTAVSGGTLKYRLQGAIREFGANRVAADFARVSMDFPLPSPGGSGRTTSVGELESLMTRLSPAVFYSAELCAKYFTYSAGGGTRLYLFDDAGTMNEKIRFAGTLGINEGFLQYGEVSDILLRMFSKH